MVPKIRLIIYILVLFRNNVKQFNVYSSNDIHGSADIFIQANIFPFKHNNVGPTAAIDLQHLKIRSKLSHFYVISKFWMNFGGRNKHLAPKFTTSFRSVFCW